MAIYSQSSSKVVTHGLSISVGVGPLVLGGPRLWEFSHGWWEPHWQLFTAHGKKESFSMVDDYFSHIAWSQAVPMVEVARNQKARLARRRSAYLSSSLFSWWIPWSLHGKHLEQIHSFHILTMIQKGWKTCLAYFIVVICVKKWCKPYKFIFFLDPSPMIWHHGQFDSKKARRIIWHQGQFDT